MARQRGIALIAVLGFLTVMSLIVVSVVGAARTSIKGSARHLARVQAQAAVDSGIDLALLQLMTAQFLLPPVLTAPQELTIGGYKVVVTARPETAKIDLNFADVVLLMGMFRAAGADDDQASALASAVLDWRDDDDLLHVNGAEANEYAAAGLKYGPANKNFESLDELRLVLGVTGDMFECLRNDVTVLAQSPNVDITRASALVRRAAGVNPDDPTSAPTAQSVISGQAIGAGEVYEITARLDDARRGIHRAERVVVRITGNRRDPYWTLAAGPAGPAESRCNQAKAGKAP
jgi:general secretion pathway protein K